MKSFRSWLLLAILVGLVAKSVFSFPANRAVDISNDLLTEDTDSDDGDNDDSSDDSKKAEIAGSGDASKKTAVEESKTESSSEEASSGSDESESSPEEASRSEEGGEKQKGDASKRDSTQQAKEEDTEDSYDDDNKRTDLPKPKPKAKTSLKKRDGCCCCEPEEKEEECCHHGHHHDNCCHNECCCGHENEHEHDHHENEDCCHHHGHHHGFCHEWGNECCGEHHGHECCGHHEHGQHHNDDHEHCHEHCHHCCEKHEEEEEPDCCCCCCDHKRKSKVPRRSDIPVGYHCHDMVSKDGSEKTKRFCVPVYGETRSSRSDIPSVVKKQTVHVGYGYASGDNYRLGYQEGGMGGLASSFTGQIGADHGGNFDAADHFNRRSLHSIHGYRQKRHFDNGHGFGAFNSGSMKSLGYPKDQMQGNPQMSTVGNVARLIGRGYIDEFTYQ